VTDSTFFAVLNINAKEHIIADPILDFLYRVRVGLADRLADPDSHCDHREKYDDDRFLHEFLSSIGLLDATLH
jgi:hypothetical protein